LKKEKSLSYNNYERKNGGIWKKKSLGIIDDINILIENYKSIEYKLTDNENPRNDIDKL